MTGSPTTNLPYCGRFAPSPSGALHFGSLLAALASYLDARAAGGRWLVRIEDLDTPRVQSGAAGDILRTLKLYGLAWDGDVVVQSARLDRYESALEQLSRCTYGCACTRREIEDSAERPGAPPTGAQGERRYPGTCRNGVAAGRVARALRVRVTDEIIGFDDRVQGRIEQNLGREIGDFVVRRADGLFAYQLAVVVDDAEQGVTHVVRGADLIASTPRQIHLQQTLGFPTPRYAHVPVAVTPDGEKLSKQTGARAVASEYPPQVLVKALRFLGLQASAELARESTDTVIAWGVQHWSLRHVPRVRARAVDERFDVEPAGGQRSSAAR
jgi:glutamyl-Q tRNA(Asp) synthetase